MSIQPPRAVACINISRHVKNPKHWQPYHCLDTEILHILIGMDSTALVAAVPYPGGCCALPKFPARNNEVISGWYHITGVIVCPQSGELLRIMQGETVGSTNLHLACNDRLLVGAINADLEANQSSVPKGVHNYMLQVTQCSFDIHCLLYMSFL